MSGSEPKTYGYVAEGDKDALAKRITVLGPSPTPPARPGLLYAYTGHRTARSTAW